MRLLLLAVLVAQCETYAGRVRAVGSRIDRASKILVVLAHPDDEILLLPSSVTDVSAAERAVPSS